MNYSEWQKERLYKIYILDSLQLSMRCTPWESKVDAITEARDLDTLAMDELIGNLITYELKKTKKRKLEEKGKKGTRF